jgi:nicotinate dehydrogenase subunit B
MAGFLHDREFSRKTFLKGGGALIVGFSAFGSAMNGRAQAAAADAVSIPGPPDPTLVDSWIAVHPDNTVSVFMGKVPNGTATDTGTSVIVAEELNLPVRIRHRAKARR